MKKITCTFYRPQRVNIKEFTNIIAKMEGDLNILINEQVKVTDIDRYVFDLLNQAKPLKRHPEMYFLGLDEPEKMPGDARVDFYYRPTYIGAAIIIRSVLLHPELLDAALDFDNKETSANKETVRMRLSGLLLGCTGRGFAGHGYDGLQGLIETLTLFTKSGTREFVESYPDVCKKFTDLYFSSFSRIEEMVEEGTAKGSWGEDYTEEAERLFKLYYRKNALTGSCEREQIGNAKSSSASKEKEENGRAASRLEESQYVWYACYGSNLNSTRVQRYLDDCGGDVNATESRPFTTSGKLYFAADSSTWGRGNGVAFFDETSPDIVLMRIYKVSRSQFHSIKSLEGPKYTRRVYLGEIENTPIYTFTFPGEPKYIGAPSLDYVQTILDGLKEIYQDVSETVLLSYLYKHGGISDDARHVLAYIRKAPHAVTRREMLENSVCSDTDKTNSAVQFLLHFGLIKQDSRSRRAGFGVADPDAAFFTVPEKRDITDQVVYGVI